MNTLRLNSFSVLTLLALMSVTGFANADHNRRSFDYARVIDARPIYQTVSQRVPVERCRVETVRVDRHYDGGARLVGGLIGAAIGHDLGHGKHHQGASTLAGAIIGASIADSAAHDRRHTEYRDVERCNAHYDVQQYRELVGYDVTYRYRGEIYHTRTDSHPGDRIRVSVSVQPAF